MVSLSNHVAISLRLSTRRGTIIATATRLLRCARNDMRKTERPCCLSVLQEIPSPLMGEGEGEGVR